MVVNRRQVVTRWMVVVTVDRDRDVDDGGDWFVDRDRDSDFTLDPAFRDPYTGANAYVPGESSNKYASSAKPTFKHIPKKGMLVFDAAQFDGILKKILEFNSALLSKPVGFPPLLLRGNGSNWFHNFLTDN
ncbi:hypothetical protein Vadar_011922 [Vaccinium darrowii]|uniref:Uncharacterized protein n=1 Tax=Vaccinium darrowii TaxID=229202 RepID=A0ACB7YUW1_9ERIC|nr:hypothetical protein Vadar_011922 [Vaccinium darrowii]